MCPRQSSTSEQWEILERVLASSLFERSARLREFLRYVGTEAIQNGATGIHEQQIGAAVFGRPAFYDTSQDNIVRVNATELRKRLDAYFASEGAGESIVFEIPRGTYTPVFHPRSEATIIPILPFTPEEKMHAEPGAQVSGPKMPAVPEKRKAGLSYSLWLVAAVTMLVVTAGIVIWQNMRINQLESQLHAWRDKPALEHFWKNFLNTSNSSSIVLGDTSFSVVQDMVNFQLNLNDYLNYRYEHEVGNEGDKATQAGADRVLSLLFRRSSGSLSDFRTAQAIMSLDPTSSVLKLRSAREFSGYASRHDSSVLIGSSRSNPWVDLYRDKLDFNFLPANGPNDPVIIGVRQPMAGEQTTYSTAGSTDNRDGYCVIAFLANLSGEGHTLIIAGTDSQATEAAGDFLTHENSMLELRKHTGGTINHFQLLLHTTRVAGTPVSSSIVAFHPVKE